MRRDVIDFSSSDTISSGGAGGGAHGADGRGNGRIDVDFGGDLGKYMTQAVVAVRPSDRMGIGSTAPILALRVVSFGA